MERNIMWRVSAYCVGTVVVLLALNLYVAHHPIYRAKAHRIDELYGQLEGQGAGRCVSRERTLVVGNSYVARSFVPPDDCAFVKFTVSGMPLLDAVDIIKNLRLQHHVATVVIGVGYNEANPVESDSSMYAQYWSALPWYRLLWSAPLVRGRGMTLTLLREDIHCIASNDRCARSQKTVEDAGDVPGSGAASHSGFEKSIRSRYQEYRSSTRSISPKLHDELAKLAAVCRDRHMKLLLYTAPIAPQLRSMLGAPFVEHFHSEIRRAGVEYVDLNEMSGNWDATYFLDATHVDERGSGPVTSRILSLIGD